MQVLKYHLMELFTNFLKPKCLLVYLFRFHTVERLERLSGLSAKDKVTSLYILQLLLISIAQSIQAFMNKFRHCLK